MRVRATLGEGAEREGKGRRPLRGASAPEAEGSSEPHTQATGSPGNQHTVLPSSSGRFVGLVTQVTGSLSGDNGLWQPRGDKLWKSKRSSALAGTRCPLERGREPTGGPRPTWEGRGAQQETRAPLGGGDCLARESNRLAAQVLWLWLWLWLFLLPFAHWPVTGHWGFCVCSPEGPAG